ncbi:MAG: TIGR00730 family Rossman fold protein [Bacteroidales bacterium]|nr:TIGR00730 family Rossman fold protein [Bacteroidales bacterium]
MAKVSIYMGAADGNKPIYTQTANKLGRVLAKAGHTIIYGGANVGTMKALADGAIEEGGYIIGVFPSGFRGRNEVQAQNIEILREDLSETIFTEDFGSRIAKMDELSDASIVLPGGFGTFQEMFSYLVNQQIGIHSKPVILFNLNGYYDTLLKFFSEIEKEGFISLTEGRLRVVSDFDQVKEILKEIK